MAVVRDEEDGPLIFVHRLDERLARFDIEVVGGLVEDQEMRTVERREAEQQSCFLATGQGGDLRVGGFAGKSHLRRA